MMSDNNCRWNWEWRKIPTDKRGWEYHTVTSKADDAFYKKKWSLSGGMKTQRRENDIGIIPSPLLDSVKNMPKIFAVIY